MSDLWTICRQLVGGDFFFFLHWSVIIETPNTYMYSAVLLSSNTNHEMNISNINYDYLKLRVFWTYPPEK